MQEIKLTRNKTTWVDDEYFNELKQFKWCYSNDGYAVRAIVLEDGRKSILRMHRFIMNAPKGIEVDHQNLNKLDNRKSNLRFANSTEQKENKNKQINNKSGHKGVCWYKRDGKWHAQINHLGTRYHLGYFTDIKDAINAYNTASQKYHGDFGRTDN